MGKEMKIVEYPTNSVLSGMMRHAKTLTFHSAELRKHQGYI